MCFTSLSRSVRHDALGGLNMRYERTLSITERHKALIKLVAQAHTRHAKCQKSLEYQSRQFTAISIFSSEAAIQFELKSNLMVGHIACLHNPLQLQSRKRGHRANEHGCPKRLEGRIWPQ